MQGILSEGAANCIFDNFGFDKPIVYLTSETSGKRLDD